MLRALSVGNELGVRVLLVHAIDADARAFYVRHGFDPSPADPLNLQLLLKDVRAANVHPVPCASTAAKKLAMTSSPVVTQ